MEEHSHTSYRKSFSKHERLNSKKKIDALFSEGASFHLYPFHIKYSPQSEQVTASHQMLISVSKRKFKRAVDRNRIKRLVRESYRLNKQLLDEIEQYLSIAYIYTAKEIHSFHFIQKKLITSLNRLSRDLKKHTK